jgi:alanine dehydrogenase
MGGSGVLLTGVDTVPGADVVVVGAGNAGGEAALTAARMGARVRVFSRGEPRLQTLARKATEQNLQLELHALSPHGDGRFEDAVVAADLVIGGVLEPGKLSPKLIPRALVAAMHKGAAIVDIGIDHGGIAATSAMTKISAPTYVAEGVVHYAVANMPTLVARTATLALTAATGPFVRGLAALGIERALGAFPGLAAGLMVTGGEVVHPGLAADAGLTHPRAASIPN